MSTPRLGPSLTDLLAAAPIGLILLSPHGDIVYANGGGSLARSAEGRDPAPALETTRHAVAIDGEAYELQLTLDATDRKAREDDLIEKAYFDELTHLPNRRLVEALVTERIDRGEAFAVAFVDVDDFKNVNDYYGHTVGDGLLVALTRRIAATLAPNDLLARLGGDEFLLVMSLAGPAADPATPESRMERLLAELKRPFHIEGYEVFSDASIGVARFPKDGQSYAQLVGNADRAMYLGKSDSKGSIRFYSSEIESAALQASRMEQRLRLAIRDRRITCAYQPKVDFRADRVVGIEVLMRWRDEDGLLQPPGGMVDLAVELGLMDDLTRQIVAETVGALDLIDAHFGSEASISINVAAKQATNPGFMQRLVAELDATGQAPRFMIELTEQALLAKDCFRAHILPMIREVGAKISIDDFGVGYSSLSTLAELTVDEIKVDRSFITAIHARPRSQSVLRAIESLGHSLGIGLVVEGVETFEELAYLQATSRINVAQGYYFSRPIMLDSLPAAATRPLGRAHAPARGRPALRGQR